MLDVVIPVHNGSGVVCRTLSAILAQVGVDEGRHRIIVVDDGSSDNTVKEVAGFSHPAIRLVRMARRSGRAAACNAGAAASNAHYLLFLDADCLPQESDLLQRHEQVLAEGHQLSFGPVTAQGGDFWSCYARQVAAERERRADGGDFSGLTSCNLALPRGLYLQEGGFHEGYRHYGFEDRDLIAGLLASGAQPHYEPNAAVLHDSGASVAVLCRKMEEAGRCTAGVFQARHPAVYRDMHYSQVDVRTARKPVRLLSGPLSSLSLPTMWLAERLVQRGWLPLRLRLTLVRLASALAYLRGTRTAR